MKKIFITAVIILCLYPVKFLLEKQPYPLLMYLTARDSDNASDVYEKINQVYVIGSTTADDFFIRLSNSVPNFAFYCIRINRRGAWRRWYAHKIRIAPGPDGVATLEIKAHNRLGGETAVFTYAINGSTDALPPVPQAVYDSYNFEDWQTSGVNLFQQYTLPVIAGRTLTWDRALAVFAWASGFLLAGDEEKDYQSQPVKILQERLRNPQSRFLCGSFATFFVAACHSVGVNARLVHLKGRNGDGHYVAEVWSDQHQKWIVMDPIYKSFFCDTGSCCSALDMRNAYLGSRQREAAFTPSYLPPAAYLSLYDDIHYVMSNTFFTSPPITFWNLVFSSPAVIHWRDAETPPFQSIREINRLIFFYYLPRLLDAAAIPAVLLVVAYLSVAARRRFKKRFKN